TILERGVTLPALDVVIIRTDMFTSSAIIQIAGRVGRKTSNPTGSVICYNKGITKEMDLARKEIMSMNKLAKERGWLK
ncbi:DNA/RNA helicase, partial [Lactobacillus murinus]|nr:DNA/RNA helicase [Ligilactobacillus murinus]